MTMRLSYKINIAAVTILVIVGFVVTESALFYMDDLVDTLNERYMSLKLNNLLFRMRHDYQVLYEKGLADNPQYVAVTKKSILEDIVRHKDAYKSEVSVFTEDGQALIYKDSLPKGDPRPEHFELLAENPGDMLLLEESGNEKFFIAGRFPEWNWVIMLSLDSEQLFFWRNQFIWRSTAVLLGSILFGSLIFLLFSRRIVRPLQSLAHSAQKIASKGWHGDVPKVASKDEKDEIGQLATAFSHMVRSRALAEESLRQSEAQYRFLANNVQDIIWTCDLDFNFTYISPSVERVLGYTPQELMHLAPENWVVQQKYLQLLQEKQTQRKEAWQRGESQEVQTHEFAVVHKDSSLVWLEVSSSCYKDEAGAICGLVGVARDVSRRKELELQKEHVEQVIRHDLRHPLGGVIALPQVLLLSEKLSEEGEEVVRLIQKSGEKMLQFIDSSLALHKIESGDYKLSLKQFNLFDELKSIETELQSLLQGYNVSMRVLAEKDMPGDVVADMNLFPSMVSNLLKNAIEASPEGGSVTIAIACDGELTIAFHNQGAVPADIRDSFFDKYVTAGKGEGTGLGTYSAWLAAKSHGGGIVMETSEQYGTTVTVTIPQQGRAS